MEINKVTLYRPVGLQELLLIATADFKAFPARLSWQPIFYPVLNQQDAEQIASQWNTKDKTSGYCAIVTRFAISTALFQQYEIQNVGGEIHNELWVPAEELEVFNRDIKGKIELVKVFPGEEYISPKDPILAKVLFDLV